MLSKAWTYSAEDALAFYGANNDAGLTEEQVKRNRELYGENCMSIISEKLERN